MQTAWNQFLHTSGNIKSYIALGADSQLYFGSASQLVKYPDKLRG